MFFLWSTNDESEPYSLYDYIFFVVPSILVGGMFVVIFLRHFMSVAWFSLLQKLRPTDINSLKECCNKEENFLGEGKYGCVYRGTFENEAVAIKKIDKLKLKISNLEVELLSKYHKHKNVISLVTSWEDVNFRYIVLELAAATMENLFLKNDDPKKYTGPLPSEIEVLHQIASGITFLHSKKIVHGDIKPENILISPREKGKPDQGPQMKLTDFGLSKLFKTKSSEIFSGSYDTTNENGTERENFSEYMWTTTNAFDSLENKVDSALSFSLSTVRGTPVWMAPELHRSSGIDLAAGKAAGKPIRGSTASDMFSFGLLSFYFLTKGIHPYGSLESKRKSFTETIPNIINDERKNWEILSNSNKVKHIVLDMLNHEESKRATATGVLTRLNILLENTTSNDLKLVMESAKDLHTKYMNYDYLLNNCVGWSSAEMWAVQVTKQTNHSNEAQNFRQRIINKFPFKPSPPKLRLEFLTKYFFQEEFGPQNPMPEFMEDAVQAYCKNYKTDLPSRKPLILFGGEIKENENYRPKNVGLLIPINDVSKIPTAEYDEKILLTGGQVRLYCFYSKSFALSNLFEIIRLFFPGPLTKWQLKFQFQLFLHPLTIVCLYYKGANLNEVVASLLKNSRPDEVNFTSEGNYNTLHYVCQYYAGDNLIGIVKLLIENKIDLNATTTSGDTALHLACAFCVDSLFQMIQILIDSGSEVNAKRKSSNANALNIVTRYYTEDNLLDLVFLLIEKGVEVKNVDNQGFNALHNVCRYYRGSNLLEIVRLLVIDHGIDVNIKTKDGITAQDMLHFFNKDLDREVVKNFLAIRELYNDT